MREEQEFTAKSVVREFLGAAETEVLLVDPYVGVGTLDCLRDIEQPVCLLTGTRTQSIEEGFARELETFRREGREIDVRCHDRLHDRYVAFNDRCWLIGSSLKDAGRKDFNCLEIRDAKGAVVDSLEQKWDEGDPY